VENIVGLLQDYFNCFAVAILLNLALLLLLGDPFSAKIGNSTIEGYCFDYLLQR
jgi:hypothetical protein